MWSKREMCPIPFVGVGVAKDVACLWERMGAVILADLISCNFVMSFLWKDRFTRIFCLLQYSTINSILNYKVQAYKIQCNTSEELSRKFNVPSTVSQQHSIDMRKATVNMMCGISRLHNKTPRIYMHEAC